MNRFHGAVFVRYALIFLAAKLSLPSELTDMISTDPDLVDAVTEALIAGGVIAWYWISNSRKALAEKFGK